MSRFVERWWRGGAGVAGRALDATLLPAELAFRVLSGARTHAYDRGVLPAVRVTVPVVSIGNVAIGGAGKTPFAAWIAARLASLGFAPAVLHGGYAADEPELHRAWHPGIPVVVDHDRVRGARRAIAAGASALVLDDGFQHRRLARDVDLVLLAAETWTAAPRLLPRGPWREPPAAMRRAHAIVITQRTPDADVHAVTAALRGIAGDTPVVVAELRAARWRRGDGAEAPAPPGGTVALSGIAHPDLFLAGARAAGAQVEDALVFRDHHTYDAADASRIAAHAGGRPVVTTAKDWIKLRTLLDPARVWVLEQEVHIAHGAETIDHLLGVLPRP
jgi:tetraacyldisaccharide 4'-kinase